MQTCSFIVSLTGGALLMAAAPAGVPLDDGYPDAPRRPVVDEYHGVSFTDEYRWMEDQESEETLAWAKAQDDLFLEYAEGAALRDRLEERVTAIGNVDRLSPPLKAGDHYYFSRTKSGSRDVVIYVLGTLDDEPRVAFDFRDFFPDASWVLNGWNFSPDGRRLSFGVSPGSTSWRTTRVLDLESGELLADAIEGMGTNNVQWTRDGEHFYYQRWDLPPDLTSANVVTENPRICLHRLGTDQSEDEVVLQYPGQSQRYLYGATLTRDDRYLVGAYRDRPGATIVTVCKDLSSTGNEFVPLMESDLRFNYVHNVGPRFLFLTDEGADRGRLVAFDIRHPDPAHWTDVLPEGADRLSTAGVYGGRLIANYSVDARQELRMFDLDGAFIGDVELPGIGAMSISGTPDQEEAFLNFGNLFTPNDTYHLDLATGETSLFEQRTLNFNPRDYEMKQVFVTSADGTRVPMFVAHKKGLKLDGTAPVWMYAFGHSGWVAFPWFQAHLVAWLDLGGVYALPNLRGGGEYGAEWQAAGMGRNKPNVIADYLAAAEWLIEHKYTSADRLVANGGSGSGFLPAAAVMQRPDLFGAAVIDFPYLDMFRYHLASGFISGYGSPEDPDDFAALRSYSPYHNINRGTCYPPMLVTMAEKDQSTPPYHAYKFTAAVQAVQACEKPVLMQVIWGARHYQYGITPEASRANLTNQIAFLIRALDIDTSALKN